MVTKEDWKRWRETKLGQRIVEGLGDAIAGNFDRVTIDGQAWVKRDAEIERLRRERDEIKAEAAELAAGLRRAMADNERLQATAKQNGLAFDQQRTEIERLQKEVDGCHASDCINAPSARAEIERLNSAFDDCAENANYWRAEAERLRAAIAAVPQCHFCDAHIVVADKLRSLEQKAPWPLHHENTCRSLFTHNQKDCDCDQRQEIAQT